MKFLIGIVFLIVINYLAGFGLETSLLFLGIRRLQYSPLISHTIWSYIEVQMVWYILILLPFTRSVFYNFWVPATLEEDAEKNLSNCSFDEFWIQDNYYRLTGESKDFSNYQLFISKHLSTVYSCESLFYKNILYIESKYVERFSEDLSALFLFAFLQEHQKKSVLVSIIRGINFQIELLESIVKGIRKIFSLIELIPGIGTYLVKFVNGILFVPIFFIEKLLLLEQYLEGEVKKSLSYNAIEQMKRLNDERVDSFLTALNQLE